ncbi:MAG: hypothetical protein QXL15_04985 [Candidatus Korarchaeota archaeon]
MEEIAKNENMAAEYFNFAKIIKSLQNKNTASAKKLGIFYDIHGEWDKATTILNDILNKGIDDIIPLLSLVETKKHNFERSILLLERYGLMHNNATALKNASILKLLIKKIPEKICISEIIDYEKQSGCIERLDVEGATHIISQFFAAEKLLNANLYDKALRIISELSKSFPAAELEFLSARAFYGLGEYPLAIMQINNVLMENISDWEAWVLMGNSYWAMNKKNAAKKIYVIAKMFFQLI